MSITLWHAVGSPPSWAVRMMADILGLKMDLILVDLVNSEHKSPAFKKLNPIGTIPVLKDGDFTLTESHTILKYLLDKYGKEDHKSLYPISDREQRALVDQAMYFDTGVAFIRVKNSVLPAVFGDLDGVTPKLAKEIEDVYEVVNTYLDGRDYVASSQFTLADISLGSTILALNGLYSLDVARYPRTAAWLDRLREKTFFKNIAVPGAELLAAFAKSFWQKNKSKK